MKNRNVSALKEGDSGSTVFKGSEAAPRLRIKLFMSLPGLGEVSAEASEGEDEIGSMIVFLRALGRPRERRNRGSGRGLFPVAGLRSVSTLGVKQQEVISQTWGLDIIEAVLNG